MAKQEKMTIAWTRWVRRPATEQDLLDEQAYLEREGRSFHGEFKVGDELEYEETVELPGRYEVCDRCDGKGTHVNPSIDGNGITSEEWERDWDEDDRETYMSGGYDVTCYECHGKRVVLVVDEQNVEQSLLEEYEQAMADRAYEDACDRRTRWAEDGYRGSYNDY